MFQYSPDYTYQWYEDTLLLPNTNSNEFNYGHNGTYSCTITNLCGSYPSAPYVTNNSLFTNYPFGYITSSGSTALCNGQTVMLFEANNSSWDYQWYLNSVPISGATANSYTTSQPGVYNVRLSIYCMNTFNYINYYSNWIAVTSLGTTVPNPQISAGGSTIICPGQNVVLTETTGPGWTYQWKNGSLFIPGATNSTYTATSAGNYYCVVSNVCGSYSSNTIAVSVQPSTVTVTLSGSATICGGAFAPMSASSAGNNGTYQWKKNGSSVAGATQSTYQANTSGSYTCSITNNCGTFTSNAVSITVSGSCGNGLFFDGANDCQHNHKQRCLCIWQRKLFCRSLGEIRSDTIQ
jgi:hypothetical protein